MIIEFYETEDGDCPVAEYLDSLDSKRASKMYDRIDYLEELGHMIREPYSKDLGGSINELRVQVGTDLSRVLYFFVVGNRAVLTNGFTKKTQKTPAKEIELAKKYRADYLRRNGL